MNVIMIAVVSIGAIALILALVLYATSKKFAVHEDPRIGEVTAILPGANCGGCGFPGCSAMATAIVKAGNLEGKFCPVGGQPVMDKVAAALGFAASAPAEPMVAVVRCNGTCENRPHLNSYDGVKTCAIAAALYGGETACSYGCLGCGDCTRACKFDAIHMNPETGLPEVDEDKCTACGACVRACPKSIIELRYKGKRGRRVYVSCVNKDKGPVAKKACAVSCIACGKCFKACKFGAITIENNLSYIDYTKCKLCRQCVVVCPDKTIIDVNFPTPAKAIPEKKPAAPAAASTAAPAASAQAAPAAKPVEKAAPVAAAVAEPRPAVPAKESAAPAPEKLEFKKVETSVPETKSAPAPEAKATAAPEAKAAAAPEAKAAVAPEAKAAAAPEAKSAAAPEAKAAAEAKSAPAAEPKAAPDNGSPAQNN